MFYPVADAHCDRLYKGNDASPDVTRETLREGGVALECFALFASIQQGDPYGRARKQLRLFHDLCGERGGEWAIRHTLTPSLPKDHTAAILTIEGGEILEGTFSRLEEFYLEGVKAIALTWNHPNEIGHPARTEGGGLTVFGKDLIKRMRKRKIAADVSHLSEAGFWDVEKLCGPFMASHSNANELCAHFRNLSREQIKAIFAHGGYIGINFYPDFLKNEGIKYGASVMDVVRHIEYMLDLGGERFIGFGSDFDGMYDKPRDLAHPGHFQRVLAELEKRGMPESTCRAIAGENLAAFFDRVFWDG